MGFELPLWDVSNSGRLLKYGGVASVAPTAGNVIFNENRSGRLFIKSFVKTYLKSLCYFSFKIYFIYLSESCHVFQYGIIAPGLSTQKNPHLTKPTPKLPVPNAMGQKRSKNKC
ncbi:hypothetical protein LXL04_007361 [Taraxacum kok-saghyz]